MIGKVSIGKSFYHCISYCLEDKKELSEQQKLELAAGDQLHHKNRAEVLDYNKCFGNKQELASQFKDVQKLSRRVEKPVLHLSLRLAPGEVLGKAQLTDIGRACATEFGVAGHQFITVLHHDTKEQHIHIVANRVGFDGKAAKDGNSYRRMAEFCRRMETQYQLQKVLSPRAFLSPQERLLPRHDQRKELLKNDIRQALKQVNTYAAFEEKMKALGYTVLKGRGISFTDDKKVKTKGSEVGFSLAVIEKVLALKGELSAQQAQGQVPKKPEGTGDKVGYTATEQAPVSANEKKIRSMLAELLEPGQQRGDDDFIPSWLRKRKRKQSQGYKPS